MLEARLQVVVEDLEGELLVGRRVRREVDLGARAAPELRADAQLLQPERRHLALQQRALRDPVLRDCEVILREGAGFRHVEGALPLHGHRQRPKPWLLQRHGDGWRRALPLVAVPRATAAASARCRYTFGKFRASPRSKKFQRRAANLS